ncbi:MAG: 50S ribosomal protein L19 [Candidatus Nomurabacteria bacterium]|jgi:large subunit ribosomal protein L19|nr:50S ribosomal protein L19 [Candidatus Nomurabacteria bacterium]
MSFALIKKVTDAQKKPQVVDVRSGDTVRVYQKIKEGNKTRIQMFEGVVIRTDRKDSLDSRITVRKITSGVGVEKSYLLHSPLVEKIVVVKRSKVRRNNLTYLRNRAGKSARLTGKAFDKSINDVYDPEAEKAVEEAKEAAKAAAEEKAAAKAAEEADLAAKQAEVEAAHAATAE